MIEDLVARVFADRNAAHLAHLATNSYAAHMALGAFYDDVIGAVDSLVEAYQGRFSLIEAVDLKDHKPGEIGATLTASCAWIETNRSKIAKNVSSLENLVDALSDVYLRTLYKLENLT